MIGLKDQTARSLAVLRRDLAENGDTGNRDLATAKLVAQLDAMLRESGAPESFEAGAWIGRWLAEPLPALGDVRPGDLIDTMEGQDLVSATLAKLQSGTYA